MSEKKILIYALQSSKERLNKKSEKYLVYMEQDKIRFLEEVEKKEYDYIIVSYKIYKEQEEIWKKLTERYKFERLVVVVEVDELSSEIYKIQKEGVKIILKKNTQDLIWGINEVLEIAKYPEWYKIIQTDNARVKKIIDNFHNSIEDFFKQINIAVEKSDEYEYRKYVHKIQGIVGFAEDKYANEIVGKLRELVDMKDKVRIKIYLNKLKKRLVDFLSLFR